MLEEIFLCLYGKAFPVHWNWFPLIPTAENMALFSLSSFSLPATHTWMFLSTAETCLALSNVKGHHWDFYFILIVPLAFTNNDIPAWGVFLPHKFKVCFPSRYGICVQSCSGIEDNKSNEFNVFSSFYLDLALPVPLKPAAVGTFCWCLHCSRGGGKEGKTRKRGIFIHILMYCPRPRNELSVQSSLLNSSSSDTELWNSWAAQTRGCSSHTNEDFTTEQLLMPRKLERWGGRGEVITFKMLSLATTGFFF